MLRAKTAELLGWYKEYREASFCDIWTELELLKHIPADVRNRIVAERNAKRRDTSFSFEEALQRRMERHENHVSSIVLEEDIQ